MKEHKLTDEEFEIKCMLLTFDRAIRNAKEHEKVCLDFVDVSVLEKLVNICKSQKAEIEALKLLNSTYECDTSRIKAVAIQEFANRLKEKMGDVARVIHNDICYYLVGKSLIDTTAKELTEEL